MSVLVITIFKNNWEDVRETLSSLNGSPLNIQLVLKNGGNHLNSVQIEELNKFRESMNIFLVERFDRGIYDAMNQALDFVNYNSCIKAYDWIWFLNSGDVLKKGSFSALNFKSIDKETKLLIGEPSTGFYKLRGVSQYINPLEYLQQKIKICHQAILFHSSLFEVIRFNSRFAIISDFCILYDIIKSHKITYYGTPEILIKPGGLSSRGSLRLELEIVIYLFIKCFRNPSYVIVVALFWRIWQLSKHLVKKIRGN